jgi:hypothetical protein
MLLCVFNMLKHVFTCVHIVYFVSQVNFFRKGIAIFALTDVELEPFKPCSLHSSLTTGLVSVAGLLLLVWLNYMYTFFYRSPLSELR